MATAQRPTDVKRPVLKDRNAFWANCQGVETDCWTEALFSPAISYGSRWALSPSGALSRTYRRQAPAR
jgi:hypothetical protein